MASLWAAPDFSGYLEKQGKTRTTWKTRYFVLKGNNLFYCKDAKDSEMCGIILLEGANVKLHLAPGHEHRFCVEVSVSSSYASLCKAQQYILAAPNSATQESWGEVLVKAAKITHSQQLDKVSYTRDSDNQVPPYTTGIAAVATMQKAGQAAPKQERSAPEVKSKSHAEGMQQSQDSIGPRKTPSPGARGMAPQALRGQEVLRPSTLSKIRAFLVCASATVTPGKSISLRTVRAAQPGTLIAPPLDPRSLPLGKTSPDRSRSRQNSDEQYVKASTGAVPMQEPVFLPLPAMRRKVQMGSANGSGVRRTSKDVGLRQGKDAAALLPNSSSRRFRGYLPVEDGQQASPMVHSQSADAPSSGRPSRTSFNYQRRLSSLDKRNPPTSESSNSTSHNLVYPSAPLRAIDNNSSSSSQHSYFRKSVSSSAGERTSGERAASDEASTNIVQTSTSKEQLLPAADKSSAAAADPLARTESISASQLQWRFHPAVQSRMQSVMNRKRSISSEPSPAAEEMLPETRPTGPQDRMYEGWPRVILEWPWMGASRQGTEEHDNELPAFAAVAF